MFDSYATLNLCGRVYKATAKSNKNGKAFLSMSLGVTEKIDGKWGKQFFNVFYYNDTKTHELAEMFTATKPIIQVTGSLIIDKDGKMVGVYADRIYYPSIRNANTTDTYEQTAMPSTIPDVDEDDIPF